MTAIGLVGCGRWGAHVLRDLLALGCSAHVVDPAADARERALSSGASSAVGPERAHDALATTRGVVVASPARTHADWIFALLPLDVPLFVEKPIAPGSSVRSRLRRLPERDARRVFVMHKWRRHPAIEAMAAIARGGELGKAGALVTRRLQERHEHSDVDAVWTLAPHDVSIALEIFGEVLPPVEADAIRATPDGAVTGLTGVCGVARTHRLAVDVAAPKKIRSVELHCEGGVVRFDGDHDSRIVLRRESDRGREEIRATRGDPPLFAELSDFVRFLGGGAPPKSALKDGLAVDDAVARLRALAGLPE